MKIAVLTVAVVILAAGNPGGAAGAQGKSEDGRQVTVYTLDNVAVPIVNRALAQILASQMFAGIGVTLHWKSARPPLSESSAIVIEFAANTPAALLPGAYAYALPYEGTHIRIFWDRIDGETSPREVLAHVMVHEITHILQGEDRHSAEGIMKAHWTQQDRIAMKFKSLRFAPEDVQMIYKGVDDRAAHASFPAAPAINAVAVQVAAR